MKKPIFGIIAVFCAQLTFIGYNYLERPIDTASVSPVTALSQGLAVIEPERDTVFVVRSDAPPVTVRVNRKTVAEPAFTTAKKTIKPPPRNLVDRTPGLIAFQRPIVITYRTEYPNTSTAGRESDDRGYTASAKPYNEKKSLVSKALPRLKKPYDWLKAIGSKLK